MEGYKNIICQTSCIWIFFFTFFLNESQGYSTSSCLGGVSKNTISSAKGKFLKCLIQDDLEYSASFHYNYFISTGMSTLVQVTEFSHDHQKKEIPTTSFVENLCEDVDRTHSAFFAEYGHVYNTLLTSEIVAGNSEQAATTYVKIGDVNLLRYVLTEAYSNLPGPLNLQNILKFIDKIPNCSDAKPAYSETLRIMKGTGDHLKYPILLLLNSMQKCKTMVDLIQEVDIYKRSLLDSWTESVRNGSSNQVILKFEKIDHVVFGQHIEYIVKNAYRDSNDYTTQKDMFNKILTFINTLYYCDSHKKALAALLLEMEKYNVHKRNSVLVLEKSIVHCIKSTDFHKKILTYSNVFIEQWAYDVRSGNQLTLDEVRDFGKENPNVFGAILGNLIKTSYRLFPKNQDNIPHYQYMDNILDFILGLQKCEFLTVGLQTLLDSMKSSGDHDKSGILIMSNHLNKSSQPNACPSLAKIHTEVNTLANTTITRWVQNIRNGVAFDDEDIFKSRSSTDLLNILLEKSFLKETLYTEKYRVLANILEFKSRLPYCKLEKFVTEYMATRVKQRSEFYSSLPFLYESLYICPTLQKEMTLLKEEAQHLDLAKLFDLSSPIVNLKEFKKANPTIFKKYLPAIVKSTYRKGGKAGEESLPLIIQLIDFLEDDCDQQTEAFKTLWENMKEKNGHKTREIIKVNTGLTRARQKCLESNQFAKEVMQFASACKLANEGWQSRICS